MAEPASIPQRGWPAVVLVVAGGFILLTTVINGGMRAIPDFPTTFFGTASGLLFASFALVPIAIIVAFLGLGLGGNGRLPLGGYSARSRLLFFCVGIFAAAAQYAQLGFFLTYASGGGSETPATVTLIVLTVLAVIVAAVASVVIIRVRVATGFARWALPVATVLVAASLPLANLVRTDWGDIPHGLGLVLLGVAYWRVGLVSRRPVPAMAESLAE